MLKQIQHQRPLVIVQIEFLVSAMCKWFDWCLGRGNKKVAPPNSTTLSSPTPTEPKKDRSSLFRAAFITNQSIKMESSNDEQTSSLPSTIASPRPQDLAMEYSKSTDSECIKILVDTSSKNDGKIQYLDQNENKICQEKASTQKNKCQLKTKSGKVSASKKLAINVANMENILQNVNRKLDEKTKGASDKNDSVNQTAITNSLSVNQPATPPKVKQPVPSTKKASPNKSKSKLKSPEKNKKPKSK